MTWKYDLEAAKMQASTNSKSTRHPPDWVRCSFFNEKGQRCKKDEQHTDSHKAEGEE